MANTTNCVFCLMQQGKVPYHLVWEDDKHFAFLSIFPNTLGFTVVATKAHYGSYAFEQADNVLADLVVATKQVATILDHHFDDVGRCGMFFEGYGVDHLHSKLYPMHGTGDTTEWYMRETGTVDDYFEQYPGYLASNNSHRADDDQLATLAAAIRKSATQMI